MEILPQSPEHLKDVLALHTASFGRVQEARLTDGLLRSGKGVVSLVAVEGTQVIGHVLFTRMRLWPDKRGVRAAGLGPISVHPERRNRGVASLLIEAGLSRCRELGFQAVFVLGDVEFYSRFGFASIYVIDCEFDAPEGTFMAMELTAGALAGTQGKALYEPEFALVAG